MIDDSIRRRIQETGSESHHDWKVYEGSLSSIPHYLIIHNRDCTRTILLSLSLSLLSLISFYGSRYLGSLDHSILKCIRIVPLRAPRYCAI